MEPMEYALAILKQYPNVTLTQVYTRTICISHMQVREMDLHFFSTHYRPQVSLREHTLAASLLGRLSLQLLLHPEYLSVRLHFGKANGVRFQLSVVRQNLFPTLRHHTNNIFLLKTPGAFRRMLRCLLISFDFAS